MRIFALACALLAARQAKTTQLGDDMMDICLTSPLQDKDKLTCEASTAVRKRITWRNGNDNNNTVGGLAWQEPDPGDCIGENCIFLDPVFDGGIALISTPENAWIMEQFLKTEKRRVEEPPYKIAEIPGKGQGLVATRAIKQSEVIMTTLPKLVVQLGPPFSTYGPEIRIPLADRAVFKLPEKAWVSFIMQHGEDINDRISKNCFLTFLHKGASGIHNGCFPEAAKFNHDCRPNALYYIQNSTHNTVAVRDIAEGEELTVTYIDSTAHFHERQERLTSWGFSCNCPLCSAGPEAIAASDERLDRIRKLEAELDDFSKVGTVTAETGAELVRLYEEEGLHLYLGAAYTRAAINFALFGETEKAQQYAALAAEASARQHGPEAMDSAPMRTLAKNPEKHWSWGRRRYDMNWS